MTAIKCPTCGHPDLAQSECECTKPQPESLIDELKDIIAQECGTQTPLTTSINVNVKDGYLDLFTILHRALSQAQDGKGSERHANGNAFNDQPIMAITRRHGLGFTLGQAEKKITEAHGMVRREELDAAERELLGAINYVAAAILRLHELEAQKKEE